MKWYYDSYSKTCINTACALVSVAFAVLAQSAVAQTLEEYAAQCDLETGVTVPDFNSDPPDLFDGRGGTPVPTTTLTPFNARYPNGSCDRPNQLNQECDPGSNFQVLVNTDKAYVVAHSRKQGRKYESFPWEYGHYGDIAVIQHNKVNGATCFYQALGDLNGNVRAPSRGLGSQGGNLAFWETPAKTADINCVACHDNGPIIRSPYLTQITGKDRLPGAGDVSFNKTQPYYFVGADFASWKAYKVEVSGNMCNNCHRMGVSNRASNRGGSGTAREFGTRATAASQRNKNPHGIGSPIWMIPGQIYHSAASEMAAKEIKACADQFNENAPLPDTPACKITQFTGQFAGNFDWLPSVLDLVLN